MVRQSDGISPQHYARLCGVLYLYIIVAGIFAEMFVRAKLRKKLGSNRDYQHLSVPIAVWPLFPYS